MKSEPTFADFGFVVSDYDIAACIAAVFDRLYGSTLSVDELLLHPQLALALCQQVRMQQGWYLVPDYMILKALRDNEQGRILQ